MNLPKSIPWHARRAGISQDRAETLWRKALCTATEETGWVGTSEYWGAANSAFLQFLAEEKDSLCAPRVTPLLRSQIRLLGLPLAAMEDMARILARPWSAIALHPIQQHRGKAAGSCASTRP